MTTMLEVMQSRLGIQELPGKKHNPVIVGWSKAIGRPDIIDDETSWCSICMCSAAKEADMPFPPANVNPMAKSWLTWGMKVEPKDVQPGDVAIWPRGDPKSWQGHVNIVEEVVDYNRKVVCIGGNQSGLKGGDAVTRSKPRLMSEAVGFRRAVPATVPALREAGSSTIKNADRKEKLGIIAVFFTPIMEGIRRVFGPVDVPQFASLPDGLSWWQSILGGANAILDHALAHPWLAVTLVAGLGLWAISRMEKTGRVAEHAAGVPIAAEVAKLEAA
jgi:uncharacterized protein (TIGR02594 family)